MTRSPEWIAGQPCLAHDVAWCGPCAGEALPEDDGSPEPLFPDGTEVLIWSVRDARWDGRCPGCGGRITGGHLVAGKGSPTGPHWQPGDQVALADDDARRTWVCVKVCALTKPREYVSHDPLEIDR